MPKGYRTVSIKEKVHEKVEALAKKTHRTVPGLITHLFELYPEKLEKLATVGETGREVCFRAELYEILEEGAKGQGLTVEEYTAHLLRLARKESS